MHNARCLRCGGQRELSAGIQETVKCHICRGKGSGLKHLLILRLKKEIRYGLRGRKHTKEMIYHLQRLVDKLRYSFVHKLWEN